MTSLSMTSAVVIGHWSLVFDGSEHGVSSDINPVTLADDGALIFSIARAQNIASVGLLVDDTDLFRIPLEIIHQVF